MRGAGGSAARSAGIGAFYGRGAEALLDATRHPAIVPASLAQPDQGFQAAAFPAETRRFGGASAFDSNLNQPLVYLKTVFHKNRLNSYNFKL
jgi:hypothetical protein